tara:strand:- start:2200 stop:2382 length:183 start_codon:yes stop_codon:yes gene_type:complete
MENQEQKIDAIYDAIVGSDLNPNGLINRMDKLEKFKAASMKAIWTVGGVILAIGTILKLR